MDWLPWLLRTVLETLASIGLSAVVIGAIGLFVFLLAGGFSYSHEGQDFSGME